MGPKQTCDSSFGVSNGSRFVKSNSHPWLLLYSKQSLKTDILENDSHHLAWTEAVFLTYKLKTDSMRAALAFILFICWILTVYRWHVCNCGKVYVTRSLWKKVNKMRLFILVKELLDGGLGSPLCSVQLSENWQQLESNYSLTLMPSSYRSWSVGSSWSLHKREDYYLLLSWSCYEQAVQIKTTSGVGLLLNREDSQCFCKGLTGFSSDSHGVNHKLPALSELNGTSHELSEKSGHLSFCFKSVQQDLTNSSDSKLPCIIPMSSIHTN